MNQNDLEILWRTIYGEARGEPREGKVAIGVVVLNRFKSGKWFGGETIAETCQKPWQFSCWNENDPNRAALMAVKPEKPSARNCIEAALEAERRANETDFLSGVTHYHTKAAPKGVSILNWPPNWAKGKRPVAEIGQHLFYENIK
jgi:N-acetylmuramoyl-L-alanine amidase